MQPILPKFKGTSFPPPFLFHVPLLAVQKEKSKEKGTTKNANRNISDNKRLFFIGLIVGTLISEIFFSGRLSDWLVVKLAAAAAAKQSDSTTTTTTNNNNNKTPEMRIWLLYPAAILTSVGLIVWGISIDRNYHWIVGQVAFALCE